MVSFFPNTLTNEDVGIDPGSTPTPTPTAINFDGQIIHKKYFQNDLSKTILSSTESSTDFFLMNDWAYYPKPNPTGYYSIIYCRMKIIPEYMTGVGTDAVTYQLRGAVVDDRDPFTFVFDPTKYWLLDESYGFWNGDARGGGGRFTPSNQLLGGMRYDGIPAQNGYKFLFYARRAVTSSNPSTAYFRNPINNAEDIPNGWQVKTLWGGGSVLGDNKVTFNKMAVYEIEQIIYEN